MQSTSWIGLLRRFPPELQDTLVLTTVSGTEVNIQNIIRVETEYLVLRGRLAGSTDAGKVFFVPFDQINYVNLTKLLKDPEVQALYAGEPAAPAAAPLPQRVEADGAAAEMEAPAAETLPQPAAPPAPAAEAPPLARSPVAAKSAILDRLRARVAPKAPDK